MKKEYGLNHGLNVTDKNILMTRKKHDPNEENILIFGQTGVGMSFSCKKEQVDKFQETIS